MNAVVAVVRRHPGGRRVAAGGPDLAGSTMLDRVVALDVLVAVMICGLALEAAVHRHTTTLPVLVVLSLLGFVGSVSIARFTPGSDDIEAEES